MWSLTQMFRCLECGEHFRGFDLDECLFHEKSAEVKNKNLVYECCESSMLRFRTSQVPEDRMAAHGCKSKKHVIDPSFKFDLSDRKVLEENYELIFNNKKPYEQKDDDGNLFDLARTMRLY